jgi:hypothetical protein
MNGTAVDAALATLFCNGVVHSHSMGIGGGFLMTVYIRWVLPPINFYQSNVWKSLSLKSRSLRLLGNFS